MVARTKDDVLKAIATKANTNRERLEILFALRKELKQRGEEANTGDLSENAAYWNVKELQTRNELSIKIINEQIEAYEDFVKINIRNSDYVSVGSFITLESDDPELNGMLKGNSFLVVPEGLGSLEIGALSISSPVGMLCLGKMVGDKFVMRKYKIITYTVTDIK